MEGHLAAESSVSALDQLELESSLFSVQGVFTCRLLMRTSTDQLTVSKTLRK